MSDRRHKELSELTARERAARYRELAAVQLELAQACPAADIRRIHLELAALWNRLAEQADHNAPPVADRADACDATSGG